MSTVGQPLGQGAGLIEVLKHLPPLTRLTHLQIRKGVRAGGGLDKLCNLLWRMGTRAGSRPGRDLSGVGPLNHMCALD